MCRIRSYLRSFDGVDKRFVVVLLSGLLLAFGTTVSTQSPSPKKNILIIYDENTALPGLAMLDKSIRAALLSDPAFQPQIYSESMELSRFQHEGYDDFLASHYREKYRQKQIDLIIPVLGPSLNFILKHQADISPDAAIVFCGIDRNELEELALGPNTTGVLVKRDFTGTLDIALNLQPNTRNVVFIGGTTDFDKKLTETAKSQFSNYLDRVNITYISDQPLETTLGMVSKLPSETVVFISTVFKDGAGRPFVAHDVVKLVSDAASVPVYGFVDQFLGRGIVGGHLYSFESHGNKTGAIALRILRGERASEIPILEGNESVDIFDAQQLERWNLKEDRLPVGSEVRFGVPSVWGSYKWYLVALFTAIIVETVLIGSLIYFGNRRRQAEKEKTRIYHRLQEIVSNVPGVVWESRTDPSTEKRKTTFVSDYVEKMLGYTSEEWLQQKPGFGLTIVAEEEQKRVQDESDEVIKTGKERVSEFRWFTKDGKIRWIENYIAPIFDDKRGVVGLRGVALDVTDRKLAEEHAQQTEEKDRAILAAIPDLMFLQTDDGVYLDFHAREPNDLLVPPDSIIGKNMRDILPAELADKISACFARAREDGEPEVLEYSVEFNGGKKWFEARMVRIKKNILSVVRDITMLRRTEFEAQEISGRLITAHEDERARLARELHDDACQNLALLSVQLDLFSESTKSEGNGSGAKIKMLSERVSELSEDLRSLSHQLHPARLQHLGLSTAIKGICNEIEAAHLLKVEFSETNVPPTLPAATSLNVYRIVQESLQNVVKHSGATEASVTLSVENAVMNLKVVDNGRGFDIKAAHPQTSLGLISLRERVRLLHGSIIIDSKPNAGTCVEATIPI